MNFISHDHSGKLQHGVFWELNFGECLEVGDDWFCIPNKEDDAFFVEVTNGQYESYTCQCQLRYSELTAGRFDLQADTDAPVFDCTDASFCLLSDAANRALMNEGLTKFKTVQLLPEPFSLYQKPMWSIWPTNRYPIDRHPVIDGRAPVCPVCRGRMTCPNCGRLTLCRRGDDVDLRYFSSRAEMRKSKVDYTREIPVIFRDKSPVVDGSKWQGEDVVKMRSQYAVTWRFLKTMEKLEFGPVECAPIPVWIDNCTPEQLELLDQASDPDAVDLAKRKGK